MSSQEESERLLAEALRAQAVSSSARLRPVSVPGSGKTRPVGRLTGPIRTMWSALVIAASLGLVTGVVAAVTFV